MAAKLTSKKPTAKKASPKKAAANGPTASAGAKPATEKKRVPATTIRALTELKADELNRHVDAADLLEKLSNERGDTKSALPPNKTAPAIWGRIVKPDRANLTPEAARAILKLDFDPEDHRRVDELSAKAQKGTLTPQERAELEEYIRVGYELAVLQSRARLSLKRVNMINQTKGKEPSGKKASPKRAATAKKAAANGPAAAAGAKPATKAKKQLPAATIRAPKEIEAGEVDHEAAPCTRSHIPNERTRKALRDADAGKDLTRYVDADDLFKKLGIKLGQEKA